MGKAGEYKKDKKGKEESPSLSPTEDDGDSNESSADRQPPCQVAGTEAGELIVPL